MGSCFVFFFTYFKFSEYLYNNIIIKMFTCVITCLKIVQPAIYFRVPIIHGLSCILYTLYLPTCVQFVDGWELNGQLFPNEQDHPKQMNDRFFEMCGTKKRKQILKSSQNAALIQYRVPRRGNGFSFYVSFIDNPTRTYKNDNNNF